MRPAIFYRLFKHARCDTRGKRQDKIRAKRKCVTDEERADKYGKPENADSGTDSRGLKT